MSASAMMPTDHPCMIAWKAYKQTDEYKNTRKWALYNDHVDGSLWAAFEAGFRRAAQSASDHLVAGGTLIERLQNAVEGECEGLMIDDRQAVAILAYVLSGEAPRDNDDLPQVPWPASGWALDRIKTLEVALAEIADGFVAAKDAPQAHDEAVKIARAALSAPEAEGCQYAQDMGMPEHKCSVRCVYEQKGFEAGIEQAARVAERYDETDTLSAPKSIAAAIRALVVRS